MILGREEQTSRLEEIKDRTGAKQKTADHISVIFFLTALLTRICDPGDLGWGNSIASWLVVMEKYVINIEHLVGQEAQWENNG